MPDQPGDGVAFVVGARGELFRTEAVDNPMDAIPDAAERVDEESC
jgi:hypothetical protein